MKKTKKLKVFLKKHWLVSLLILAIAFLLFKPVAANMLDQTASYDYDGYDYEESYGGGIMAMTAESSYYDDSASRSYDSYDEVDIDQKIIKTGSLSLHVDDVRESADAMTAMVEEMGGSVNYSSVSRSDNSYYAYLTVRVPADEFDSAMAELKEMSIYVDYEYTNADDVTETYIDLQARLNNYYVEEEAYQDILDMAGTVEEVLEVTQALSNVRTNIESLESQLAYYDTRVDYSTIDLTLTEDESASVVVDTWRPISTIRDAFSDWIEFLQGVVDKGVYILIYGWPLLLIWLAWKIVKRRK